MEIVNNNHLGNYHKDDVKYFFSNDVEINYFPRNIGKFFKNLKKIYISGAKIKSLVKTDLQFLGSDFKDLAIDSTEIEWLEVDVFEYTPNLQTIYLNNNKIIYVEDDTFINLAKLTKLTFKNPCHDGNAVDRSAVLDLIPQIEQDCFEIDKSFPPRLILRGELALKSSQIEHLNLNLEICEQELKDAEEKNASKIEKLEWKILKCDKELMDAEKAKYQAENQLAQEKLRGESSSLHLKLQIYQLKLDVSAKDTKIAALEKEVEMAKNISQPDIKMTAGFKEFIEKLNTMEMKIETMNVKSVETKLEDIKSQLDNNKDIFLHNFTSINATSTAIDYKVDFIIKNPCRRP